MLLVTRIDGFLTTTSGLAAVHRAVPSTNQLTSRQYRRLAEAEPAAHHPNTLSPLPECPESLEYSEIGSPFPRHDAGAAAALQIGIHRSGRLAAKAWRSRRRSAWSPGDPLVNRGIAWQGGKGRRMRARTHQARRGWCGRTRRGAGGARPLRRPRGRWRRLAAVAHRAWLVPPRAGAGAVQRLDAPGAGRRPAPCQHGPCPVGPATRRRLPAATSIRRSGYGSRLA